MLDNDKSNTASLKSYPASLEVVFIKSNGRNYYLAMAREIRLLICFHHCLKSTRFISRVVTFIQKHQDGYIYYSSVMKPWGYHLDYGAMTRESVWWYPKSGSRASSNVMVNTHNNGYPKNAEFHQVKMSYSTMSTKQVNTSACIQSTLWFGCTTKWIGLFFGQCPSYHQLSWTSGHNPS